MAPQQVPPSTSKIVLVTGVNGYIALHIVHLLLQHGHTVRGTSRSANARDTILSAAVFQPYIAASPCRYEHVIVPDMTIPGAFDHAVENVHGVIHVASPLDFSLKTVDDFIRPAVGGVTSILTSIANLQSSNPPSFKLESFVLTSSIAAVTDRWAHPDPVDGGEIYHFSESDWNDNSERVAREAENFGTVPFPAPIAYGASKIAAERAMWAFRDSHPKLQITGADANGIGFSAINPGVVTGPPLIYPSSPSGLNVTLQPIWKIWSGEAKTHGQLPAQIGMGTYIDVRDVARIHVWCFEHPHEADGERFLVTNGKAPPQAIADVLWDAFEHPERREKMDLWQQSRGTAYSEGTFEFPETENSARSDKAKRALGIGQDTGEKDFKRFDESVLDTVNGFLEVWPDLHRDVLVGQN